MTGVPGRRRGGFSLLELMVVSAIAALIVTLAVPSYQRYVDRAHRMDAITRLMQAAGCQERLRSVQGGYDRSRCLPPDQPRYVFAYAGEVGPGFTLTAAPRAGQSDDACGTLILEHTGARRISSKDVDDQRCWSGR